jgi:hypothetical protein
MIQVNTLTAGGGYIVKRGPGAAPGCLLASGRGSGVQGPVGLDYVRPALHGALRHARIYC